MSADAVTSPQSSGLIADPAYDVPTRDQEHWHRVAEELADTLAVDVAERDRAGQPPFAEVELLRRSGLLGLRVPASAGGVGADLATTFDVIRTLARVDGSIAHLFGYHLNFGVGALADAEPEVSDRVWRESLAEGWFWASTGSPQDPGLVLQPQGAGWTVSGRKNFATGSRVADRIVGYVRDPDSGHGLAVALDPARPELVRRDDWDVLGQRLSASNGLELRDYPLTAADVLIDYGPDDGPHQPYRSLGALFSQVLFSQLSQGIAEGVLLRARDYTRTVSRPWFHAGVERAVEDPHIVAQYGLLVSRLRGVDALNVRATAALEWAYGQGEALTAQQRGEVSEVIATSRVLANEVCLDLATRVYDLMGARAASSSYGFDLAWRNLRTLTLHDPQAYKAVEVGEYFLTDTLPTPSPYR